MEAREQLRLAGLRNVLFAEDTLGVESGVFGGAARHLLSRGLCAVVRLHLGIGAQSPHSRMRRNENNTPGVTVTSQDVQDGTLPNTEDIHRHQLASKHQAKPTRQSGRVTAGNVAPSGFSETHSEAGVRHGALSESQASSDWWSPDVVIAFQPITKACIYSFFV